MANRRIELPNTVAECHTVILELHVILDELEFRMAQLERELYGQRRERFIDDESDIDEAHTSDEATTDEVEMDPRPEADPPATDPLIDDLPDVHPSNDLDNEPLLDSDAVTPSLDPSSADVSSDSTP